MTLSDALSQPLPNLAALRGMWLVFDAELLADFNAAQEGATTFLASPTALTDGRFALCADLLSEIGDGGVYAAQFQKLPIPKFTQVTVVPVDEVTKLFPSPQHE